MRRLTTGTTASPSATASAPPRQLGRHAALHVHQARIEQHVGDETIGARRDRQAAEDLLVLDLLGTRGAHALHDEVEAVGLLGIDGVVVTEARRYSREPAPTPRRISRPRGRQRQRRRTRAIDHAHDDGAAAAVFEELLDGVTQRGGLPESAEHARVVGEAANRHGFVDGALEGAADEGGDVGGGARDDAYRAGLFGGWNLRIKGLGQKSPLGAASRSSRRNAREM